MTVRELAAKLWALPPEQQELPVLYMNEVWLKPVESVTLESENEYGVDGPEGTPTHIRLSH